MSIELTDFFIERDGREIDLVLSCDYSPETPDVPYLRNGDPGHPGDPEEFEVLSAAGPDGTLYDLTPTEQDSALDMAREKYAEMKTP